jgi:GTPase involved in cell partitioning and DNA repair
MEELKNDSSSLAREYITLGRAYLKHIERMDRIMAIADKYYSDLKNTSEKLLLTRKHLKRMKRSSSPSFRRHQTQSSS